MCDDGALFRGSKAVSPSVGGSGSTFPSADDDLLDELIGDIGDNISNVGADATATSDDQLLLEMQELLS